MVPFEEEDESPFVGLLQVEAACSVKVTDPVVLAEVAEILPSGRDKRSSREG